MKPLCMIIDLDGTLADCEHRRHHLTGDRKNWGAFNAAMGEDKPNGWCMYLIHQRASNVHAVLVSGRSEDFRRVTELWLTLHRIEYDALIMRPSGDSRQDAIVKEEILYNKILPHWEPIFAVDDRKQVVEMWRRNGITCLQCAEGDF